MNQSLSPHRLARDGRHAYLDISGAYIGAAVPLLEKDAAGRWQPRSRATFERLFRIGYGRPVDMERRMARIAAVARALNEGDRSSAASALEHAHLPPLPDEKAAQRMAKADELAETFKPDEPSSSESR